MTTKLTVRADKHPVWLCFEPWAVEYTVEPGTSVAITFDDHKQPVELTHWREGIIFLSLGRPPDIWTEDGEPLQTLSDVLPDTSTLPLPALRFIMDAAPPHPPSTDPPGHPRG